MKAVRVRGVVMCRVRLATVPYIKRHPRDGLVVGDLGPLDELHGELLIVKLHRVDGTRRRPGAYHQVVDGHRKGWGDGQAAPADEDVSELGTSLHCGMDRGSHTVNVRDHTLPRPPCVSAEPPIVLEECNAFSQTNIHSRHDGDGLSDYRGPLISPPTLAQIGTGICMASGVEWMSETPGMPTMRGDMFKRCAGSEGIGGNGSLVGGGGGGGTGLCLGPLVGGSLI